METCRFSDFMQSLRPWLNDDYIRKAVLDKDDNFRLFFVDGGERAYRIDGCTKAQLTEVIGMMQQNGIKVEKAPTGSQPDPA